MILDFFRQLGWLPIKQPKIDTSKISKIKDPFAVIPVKPEKVEVREDSIGNLHLRLDATPEGSTGRLARHFGYNYYKKLQLDKYGSEFYSQIDGVTTLGTIVDRMAKKFNKKRKTLESGVILITRKLMQMNFVALIVPAEDDPPSQF